MRPSLRVLPASGFRRGLRFQAGFHPSVGARIAVLSAVPLVGLALIFALFATSQSQVGAQLALSRADMQTALDVKAFRDQIVATQLGISSFLLQPSEATRAALVDARDASNRNVAALLEADSHSEGTHLPASIAKGMKTVSYDVDVVVKAQNALGYDSKSGLAGAMNTTMDALEAMIADDVDYSDPLAIAMSQEYRGMRRNQLRFTLSHVAADRDAYGASSAAMKKDVTASFLPDATKAKISAAIDAAQSAFTTWADTVDKVTVAQNAAALHFKGLSAAADSVVAASSRSANQAEGRLGQIQSQAALLVGLTIVAVVVLCCVLCFFIGRSISGPIRRLSRAMQRMVGGDLDVPVEARQGRDEMAEMTRAVLAFKEAALEKRALELDAERQRTATDEERAGREREKAEEARADRLVVDSLAEGLGQLSIGNLLSRIEVAFAPKSERLRQDFNGAVDKLNGTMVTIGTNTEAIRSRTDSIATAAQDLARRTEQQAASLEETAASLHEITATVKSTADHAGHARDVVSATKASAEASGAVIKRAIDAMHGIESSSKQISQIIGVIDEIAFQTNLLALNAGVEAARAGEAGRGFAVVASEVRALAQRSAEAAKEIKTLISTSTAQVDQGVDLVAKAGDSLQRILIEVSDLNTTVSAIAASAVEQAQGLAEVNIAVGSLDQITQKNAAMVEETTAAADSLAQETEQLVTLISQFKTRSPNVSREGRRATAASGRSGAGWADELRRASA